MATPLSPGESEIVRLVDEPLAVAQANRERGHYGGALLTFPELGVTPGTMTAIRVVDAQQRLTAVSMPAGSVDSSRRSSWAGR
ncbi:MAG: hypothetical protein F4169_14625 [Gammaproteobacteria bacterium]|nr:hypothetical protein [Gammaproteobacteria bacterium]MYK08425.1 hypothetical protein [Terriglobia bacterium]